MTPRRRLVLAALLVTALVAGGGAALALAGGGRGSAGGAAAPEPAGASSDPLPARAAVERALAALPQRPGAVRVDADRLAPGLVPPTNRWFSSLALGPQPQAVFPLPLGYLPRGDGFVLGVPRVTASPSGVVGSVPSDVAVRVAGATAGVVVAYDALTVTVELRAGARPLGRVVLAQGVPAVTFTASADVEVDAGIGGRATAGGRSWATSVVDGDRDGTRVRLREGGRLTWLAAPDGVDATSLLPLLRPVVGGSVGWGVAGGRARTDLTWRLGAGDGPGLVTALPHQVAGLAGGTRCDLGTYPGVLGTLRLCRGSTLGWTVPVHDSPDRFDLATLTGAERTELREAVRADVAATPAAPTDTYGAGKWLQRSLGLFLLAEDLGMDATATSVRAALVARLDRWLDPRGCRDREVECFVHDPAAHTVLGLAPSFGTDEANDHHFHWGYLLRTAGTLAQGHPELVARWGPVLDALAADVGAQGLGPLVPDARVFDAYAGHSWASGTSPFADGNNQESTSEAVNAWQGVLRWARASDQPGLAARATWLAASEQDAAVRYGLAPDTTDPVLRGLGGRVLSLTWGNKRDHATWFSADPAAVLGILVIPLTPDAAGYLEAVPEARVRAAVAEASAGDAGFRRPLGDLVLAYAGLGGEAERQRALAVARGLEPRWVDAGSSRAQLLVWLLTVRRG